MRATEFLKDNILGSTAGRLLGKAFGNDNNDDILDKLTKFVGSPNSVTVNKPSQSTKVADPSSVPANKKDKYISQALVKSYLSTKMDNVHVAGIMANIQAESGFRPGVIGDNGTSGGLFQHHAGRFRNMVAAAGGPDNWKTNWQGQIDFALSEPAGRKYLNLKFNSPEQASKWFTLYFEIPANKEQVAAARSLNANRFA
jgi:hypothetical protein